MARAAAIFISRGMKFTELRQTVLEVIVENGAYIGAYGILRQITLNGRTMSPVSVYRALDSLLDAGVVRKLKSKNAYFPARVLSGRREISRSQLIYLVCETCSRATEADAAPIYDAVERVSEVAPLPLAVDYIEVSGTCERCASAKVRRTNGARARNLPQQLQRA
jgi:Fur family zinc uptake transcriptional regulator